MNEQPSSNSTRSADRPSASQKSEHPTLCMSAEVFRSIMLTIGAVSPETGGLLLGPIGSNEITEFYLDANAQCTGGTYAPDHVTLNEKMKTLWIPSGLDMKGFAHSHPPGVDRLSHGDLVYIARLLKKNTDMDVFAAPIVMPCEYRMCPYVVLRNAPQRAVRAHLKLF